MMNSCLEKRGTMSIFFFTLSVRPDIWSVFYRGRFVWLIVFRAVKNVKCVWTRLAVDAHPWSPLVGAKSLRPARPVTSVMRLGRRWRVQRTDNPRCWQAPLMSHVRLLQTARDVPATLCHLANQKLSKSPDSDVGGLWFWPWLTLRFLLWARRSKWWSINAFWCTD